MKGSLFPCSISNLSLFPMLQFPLKMFTVKIPFIGTAEQGAGGFSHPPFANNAKKLNNESPVKPLLFGFRPLV